MGGVADTLSPKLLDELWRRSGVHHGRLCADARLAALFDTWCRVVPYDTVTKIVSLCDDAPLWGMDPDAVVTSALERGLGATCFPLASGFAAAARADGFDATVHLANSVGRTGAAEHAVCVVSSGGLRWLCDPAFVHRVPAALPTVDGAQHRVGPPWSPLWAACVGGEVRFTVERGASTERRTYVLGDAISGGDLDAAYDVAGRWESGLTLYMRRALGASQVVASDRTVTTKDRDGLVRVELGDGGFDAWLATVGVTGAGAADVRAAMERVASRAAGQGGEGN